LRYQLSIVSLTLRAVSGSFKNGAFRCKMVYNYFMGTTEKTVRQSVSLPSPLAKRVKALAKNRKVSSNRILVELVETGLRSKEEEKRRFFELADLLSKSTDAKEQQELKEKLARMTFGE
jgi:uncharacterized Fe-S cluster-containing radical SAM superfamily protein